MTLLTLSNAAVLAAREALSASSSSRGPGHRHRVSVIVIWSASSSSGHRHWFGRAYFIFYFFGVYLQRHHRHGRAVMAIAMTLPGPQ
jgi:hypothetical protein